MTEAPPLQQIGRTCVLFRGRKLIYFSGCDYFRLASHAKVLAAMRQGLERYGLNVAASRMTTGNHILYGELERSLAGFFKTESALVVPTGYLSNLAAAQALEGEFTHALVDAGSHPSILDALKFLRARTIAFKHRDPADLARCVRKCGSNSKLILLSDGMFSKDGATAPLSQYDSILPRGSTMLIDDAHGAGVLGRNGRGTPELERVTRCRVIQTITLSKAFGAYGGAILTTRTLRRKLVARSKLFIGSTPLPLPLAHAALEAVRLLKHGSEMRARLNHNLQYVRQRLSGSGLATHDTPGPIVALFPERQGECRTLRRALLNGGIYPPFLRYPTGPETGYFRFVISSEHTRGQLERLCAVLTDWEQSRA